MFAHYGKQESGPTPDANAGVNDLSALNTPFSDGKSKLVLNFACEQDGAASTLGLLPTNDILLTTARKLATKGILAADGNCVVAEAHRDIVESYIRYAEQHGLISNGALERVLFVQDPTNIRQVLGRLSADKKSGLMYIENAAASDLLTESGVHRIQDLLSAAAIEKYANKSVFRDKIADLYGPGAFPFPRVKVQKRLRENDLEFEKTVQLCKDALGYYTDHSSLYDGDKRRALFLQTVDGAGGKGNRVIYRYKDGALEFNGFYGEQAQFAPNERQIENLLMHLLESGPEFEVTPFLELLGSYAYTIMVTDSGVTLLGPRKQIMDPETNAFWASSFDINIDRDDFVDFEEQMSRVLQFGFHLKKIGFRGYSDVDVMDFLTPEGEGATAFSESNMRRDSASFILSLILRNNELRAALQSNQLSFLIDDHFIVPQEAMLKTERESGLSGAEALADFFRRQHVPLTDSIQPHGVALLSPPLKLGGEYALSLGVLARDDRTKRDLHEYCQELLKEF